MKFKILHVIDHSAEGGAQVVVADLVRRLHCEFSFSIAVLGSVGRFSSVFKSFGIPVYELRVTALRWDFLPLFPLVNLIGHQKFDLVHTHLFKSNILGAVASRHLGCRTVLHDHTAIHSASLKFYFPTAVIRRCYLMAYRYAIKHSDAVIVHNPAADRYQKALVPGTEKNIILMPNGFDFQRLTRRADNFRPSLRQELGLSEDTRIVLMIGRLEPVKDWLTFLEVASRIHRWMPHKCAFMIIGSGSQEKTLQHFIETNRLQNVFILGQRDDVLELLREANVFLLTSRFEAFPMVLIEAMAVGCPVIATRSGGPQAIITNGFNGLLNEIGDVDGLCRNLSSVLSDPRLHQKLSANASQTVTEKFDLENTAIGIARLYETVLKP